MFLVQRGELFNRFDPSAYKSTFYFTSNLYPMEKLSKVAFINPKTTFDKLDANREISFIPMEAVNEYSGAVTAVYSKKITESKGFTRFAENDLIWAKITPCMQNGKSAVARNLLQGFGCGSTEFFVIRPKSNDLLVDYLHFLLRDKRILETAQNFFGGSAGQQRVSPSFLENFPVPIPTMAVQQQIVHQMQAAYAEKQQKEAQAAQLLASIDGYLLEKLGITLPQAVEKKKTFVVWSDRVSDGRFDPAFYKPEYIQLLEGIRHTRYEKLSHLVKFSSETWNQKDYFKDDFPYIEISEINLSKGIISNVNQVKILEAPSRAKMIVRKGDIIISTTRPNRGAIAKISENEDFSIASTGFAILRHYDKSKIVPNYLHTILRHRICLTQMEQRSSGGNYPAITQDELGNINIPIPSISVQQEIVLHLEKITKQAQQLETEAKTALTTAKAAVEKAILG
jgi:type I restriction enzyme, S subunit